MFKRGLQVLLGLVLAVGAVFALLQLPIGKRVLADVLEGTVSAPGIERIEVGTITGFVPFDVQVARIALYDNDRPWLVADDIAARTSPWALLGGRVHVRSVTARKVSFDRLPEMPPKQESRKWTFPTLPHLPMWLTVDHAAVAEAAVSEQILPQPGTFSLSANYQPEKAAGDINVGLQLQRLDASTTEARGRVVLAGQSLTVDVNATDSAYLPALLDVDEAFALHVTGSGPLSDWDGSLDARLGSKDVCSVQVQLAGRESTEFQTKGHVTLDEAFVPKRVRTAIGDNVAFMADASLSPGGVLEVNDARFESPLAELTMSGRSDLEAETLSGTVRLTHTDGRRILGDTGETGPAIRVTADLSGSWTKPIVALQGAVDDENAVDLRVAATFGQRITADATGNLRIPASLLPDRFAAFSNDRFALAVGAAIDLASRRVELNSGFVSTAWARLDAHGLVDWNAQTLRADAKLVVDNAERVSEVLDQTIEGSGVITADVEGGASDSAGRLQFEFANLKYQDVALDTATFHVDAEAGPWAEDVLSRVSADLTGGTGAISVGGHRQAPVRVQAAVRRERGGDFRLANAEVTDDNTIVRASGSVDASFEHASAEVHVAADDVAPYAAMVDQPYGGRIELQAQGSYDGGAGQWQGRLDGRVDRATGLPDVALAALGEAATLGADFAFANDTLTLRNIIGRTAQVQMSGEGRYAVADQSYDATARMDVANLSFVGDAVGTPVAGRARAQAHVSGVSASFRADATVEGRSLRAGSVAVESLDGTVTAEGNADAVTAQADLTAARDDETVRVESAVRYANSTVSAEKAILTNGPNTADLRGRWNVEENEGELQVNADFPDMAHAGRLIGQEMRGKFTLAATLEAADSNSRLDARGTVSGLYSPYATAQSVDFAAALTDLFDEPMGDANVTAVSLEQGIAHFEHVTVDATFEGSTITLATDANGVLSGAAFETSARGQWSTPDQRLVVQALRGNLESYPFALEPTTVTLSGGGVEFAEIRGTFGDGSFDLGGVWSSSELDAEARWRDMPLHVAELLDGPITSGTVEGNLALHGSMDAPAGTLTLAVRGAQTPQMAEAGDLAANVDLTATLAPELLDVDTRVQAADKGEAHLAMRLPLTAGQTLPLTLDENAPWKGDLDADVDLTLVTALMGTDTHLLSGNFAADLSVGGTFAEPTVEGNASVVNGRYENADTGTILAQIEAKVAGDNRQISLVQLNATDGTDGGVEAHGEVRLVADEQYPFDFETTLKQARLVNRDDATARIDGTVTASGDMERAAVKGDLTVTQAEVILRPMPSASIPELQVVPANLPPSAQQPAERSVSVSALPETSLNIDIQIPARAFVRATDVQTEWKGTVHVGGTIQEPVVSGEAQPVRGYVSFLGRRFTLEPESTIIFDTETYGTPYLNLSATTRRQDISATLTIRGTLDELQIDMTSDPPLPREEVLAQVLFGRNLSEVSPVQALQLARAVAMFSGTLEGVPFFSGPSRLPVIDTLDIQTGEEGPTVGVGKYIADNVFVEVEQGTGQESTRARVEFEVTPHISLETSVGVTAQSGVGVLWKYDY